MVFYWEHLPSSWGRRGDVSLPLMGATLTPWWRRVILREALVDAFLGCSSQFTGTPDWYSGFAPSKESSINSPRFQRAAPKKMLGGDQGVWC